MSETFTLDKNLCSEGTTATPADTKIFPTIKAGSNFELAALINNARRSVGPLLNFNQVQGDHGILVSKLNFNTFGVFSRIDFNVRLKRQTMNYYQK